MKNEMFDIGPDQQSDPAMARLVALANEAVSQEMLVADLDEMLAEAKRKLNKFKMVELPDLMAEIGLSELKLTNGSVLKIEDFVSGSLPKDELRRDEAIKWLEENGASALIKTEVNLSFGKSEHNRALSLISKLSDDGYSLTSSMGVHAQSLLAYARERMKSGEEVPFERLGLFAGRTAKIKVPSKGRGK